VYNQQMLQFYLFLQYHTIIF